MSVTDGESTPKKFSSDSIILRSTRSGVVVIVTAPIAYKCLSYSYLTVR